MDKNNKLIVIHGFDFALSIKNAIAICGNLSNLMIKRFVKLQYNQKHNRENNQEHKFLLHNHSSEFKQFKTLLEEKDTNNLILCVSINTESLNLIKLSYPECNNIKYKILTEQECLIQYPDNFTTILSSNSNSNGNSNGNGNGNGNGNDMLDYKAMEKQYQNAQCISLFDDNISCIIPKKLYLSSVVGARNIDKLIENGITHIINITDFLENYFESNSRFTYLKIPIPDSINIKIVDHFDISFNFIDNALLNNGRVLVHCFAGKSRSASIVIGWLMKNEKMSYENALQYVRNYRPCVEPNLGFCCQLKKYLIT